MKQPFYEKFIHTSGKKPASACNQNANTKVEKHYKTEKYRDKCLTQTYLPNGKIIGQERSVFSDFTKEQSLLLKIFPQIVSKVLKQTEKHRKDLPKTVRQIFHELTDERSCRKTNYLADPSKLSAYIYYYMHWNLVRLVKILSNLTFELDNGDFIADFGAGPLTMTSALWIARPELRNKQLNWYCTDLSGKALTAGECIFNELCAFTTQLTGKTYNAWHITKITGSFGLPLRQKVSLLTAANMFNESFCRRPLSIKTEAEKASSIILDYLKPDGSILIVEPGIPVAGEFIAACRDTFIKKNYLPAAPCPHWDKCPMRAGKRHAPHAGGNTAYNGKWCHFAFCTSDAPKELITLTEQAGLHKSRAALSFLYCSNAASIKTVPPASGTVQARITSDIIRLDYGKIGRYACCYKGLLLLTEKNTPKAKLKHCVSGSMFNLQIKDFNLPLDKKTNALIVNL